ncbi:MAG: hypothetical protein IH977_07640 [Nitrospinae bacterium]|nr:hypothetical protein [Nitrospinota bacterium]
MAISMLMVKSDWMSQDQVRLHEIWEAWGIPLQQQWEWVSEMIGKGYGSGLKDLLMLKAIATLKESPAQPLVVKDSLCHSTLPLPLDFPPPGESSKTSVEAEHPPIIEPPHG